MSKNNQNKLIVGIDFGTTNSYVAIANKTINEFDVIENIWGYKNNPSIVIFTENDEVLVGQSAVYNMPKYQDQTIYEVKRLLGKKFSDPDIQRFIKKVPYKIISDKEKKHFNRS